MARPRHAPRLHRLPQRLDYTLIPAPLDLSLPMMTEKSPLPAIIVTPSSPSSNRDFSIAFLAPPPKPPMRERITSLFSLPSPIRLPASPVTSTAPPPPLLPSSCADSSEPVSPAFSIFASKFAPGPKARTLLIGLLVMFVCLCHVVAHRLAARRPHLAFAHAYDPSLGIAGAHGEHLTAHAALSAPEHLVPTTKNAGLDLGSWFGFRAIWESDADGGHPEDDFVVVLDREPEAEDKAHVAHAERRRRRVTNVLA
ncbi:hypothetical protein HGRIS_009131 [Hohenbuehelia grisea]|uniref:Uncharacterized protein n=1 Tax=Hohenbuehelia grisea TaxID=104357 RepID=A0ABR3J0M9_9AGAR